MSGLLSCGGIYIHPGFDLLVYAGLIADATKEALYPLVSLLHCSVPDLFVSIGLCFVVLPYLESNVIHRPVSPTNFLKVAPSLPTFMVWEMVPFVTVGDGGKSFGFTTWGLDRESGWCCAAC